MPVETEPAGRCHLTVRRPARGIVLQRAPPALNKIRHERLELEIANFSANRPFQMKIIASVNRKLERKEEGRPIKNSFPLNFWKIKN